MIKAASFILYSLFFILFCLLGDFYYAGELVFRLGRGLLSQLLEYFSRQMGLEVGCHIKIFPPAVKYLPAGVIIFAADHAVAKRYLAPQAGASPFQLVNILVVHFAALYLYFKCCLPSVHFERQREIFYNRR